MESQTNSINIYAWAEENDKKFLHMESQTNSINTYAWVEENSKTSYIWKVDLAETGQILAYQILCMSM